MLLAINDNAYARACARGHQRNIFAAPAALALACVYDAAIFAAAGAYQRQNVTSNAISAR